MAEKPSAVYHVVTPEDDPDDGRALMSLMVRILRSRLSAKGCECCGRGPEDIKAADLEMIRKFLQDQSVSLMSIRRGDFGSVVKEASERFPFDDEGRMVQ